MRLSLFIMLTLLAFAACAKKSDMLRVRHNLKKPKVSGDAQAIEAAADGTCLNVEKLNEIFTKMGQRTMVEYVSDMRVLKGDLSQSKDFAKLDDLSADPKTSAEILLAPPPTLIDSFTANRLAQAKLVGKYFNNFSQADCDKVVWNKESYELIGQSAKPITNVTANAKDAAGKVIVSTTPKAGNSSTRFILSLKNANGTHFLRFEEMNGSLVISEFQQLSNSKPCGDEASQPLARYTQVHLTHDPEFTQANLDQGFVRLLMQAIDEADIPANMANAAKDAPTKPHAVNTLSKRSASSYGARAVSVLDLQLIENAINPRHLEDLKCK